MSLRCYLKKQVCSEHLLVQEPRTDAEKAANITVLEAIKERKARK